MKLRLQKMVCSLLLVLPLSLLLTCAQQEDPAKMKIQELLAQGKTQLGISNFDGAIESFQLILNEYDPESADAMYGVAIASTLKQLSGMRSWWSNTNFLPKILKNLPMMKKKSGGLAL